MIQSLPYDDLVDLSLFEGPVSDESRFSAPSISDIKPSPRIEITSCDGEPSASYNNQPVLSATCVGGPMEFDYQYAGYYGPSEKQESNYGSQTGFMSKIRRNNRKNRTRDNSRDQKLQTTDCLPFPSQAFARSASDPCLNSHRSGTNSRLIWCSERESWLYTNPSPSISQRPSTSNGDGREACRAGTNSFLTEYYNDDLKLEEPPPPYEHHRSDAKTTTTTRSESQWSRIAQRVCRSPR